MKYHGYHWENTSIQNTKHIGWLKTLRHTPENTYLQNWPPISQPQIGLSWAILRALQAWRQGEQEVEEEEERERKRERERGRGRQRERGVGHGRRGYARNNISDDIRATLVDHVINHGLTMREAGQRVLPHLSRFTVASIIRTFRLENRYVFNSPLQTVFTVLYHITLLYHMYCIASWLVLLL